MAAAAHTGENAIKPSAATRSEAWLTDGRN
jgi:hypothetical protein